MISSTAMYMHHNSAIRRSTKVTAFWEQKSLEQTTTSRSKLSVFESALSIPRFARFCVLHSEDPFEMPKSYVEVVIKIRNQRVSAAFLG